MTISRRKFTQGLLAAAPLAIAARNSLADTFVCTEIRKVPYEITQPGVYCLANNVVSTHPCNAAIRIKVSNVTLDLNGHIVSHEQVSPNLNASAGISIDRNCINVKVKNGHIQGFFVGLYGDSNTYGCEVSGLTITNCTSSGIAFYGPAYSTIRNNRISSVPANPALGFCGVTFGIVSKYGENITIEDNEITFSKRYEQPLPKVGIGIYIPSSSSTVVGNVVHNPLFGIVLDSAKYRGNYVVGSVPDAGIVGGVNAGNNKIIYES